MASASDARAGGAWVEFYTKGDKAVRAAIDGIAAGLKSMATGVAIAAGGLAAMSAAVTGPLLHGVGVASEWASQVVDAARRTGTSFQEVQELAAGLRVGFDELGTSVAHMSSFFDGAIQGSAEATRALERLGLSVQDLQGLSQNDKLMRIADALAAIGNENTRISLQRAIFGRSGMSLNLSGGAEGIRQRQQRSRDLGGIMSGADVQTMRSYNLALGELGTLTRGIWSTVGAAVAPVLTQVINAVIEAGISFRRWLDDNRDLIMFVGAAAAAVGGLAAGLFGAAAVIRGTAAAIGFLSPVINLVRGGFGLLRLASIGWGLTTATASTIATASFLAFQTAYSVGQGIIAAATMAYNFVTGLATGATAGYSAALAIAAVWEAIVTGGTYALVLALGAVAIAAGVFVLLTGGIIGLSFAVAALGIRFDSFHSSLEFVDDALAAIRTATVAVWNVVTTAVTTAWRAINSFLDVLIPGRVYIRALGSAVLDVFGRIASGIGRAAATVVDIFIPAFSRIGDVVTAAVGNIGARFSSMWPGMVSSASTAVSGIAGALRSGNFGLAWDILKTAGELAWLYVKDIGLTTWVEVKFAAFESIIAIGVSLRETFYSAWNAIQNGFFSLIAEFKASWAEAIGWVQYRFLMAAAARLPRGSLARERLEGQALDARIEGNNRARDIRSQDERDVNTRNARFQRDADLREHDDATARTIRESQLALDRANAHGDPAEIARLQQRLADLNRQANAPKKNRGQPNPNGGDDDGPEKWASMGSTFSAAAAAGMFGGGDIQTQIRDINQQQLDVQQLQLEMMGRIAAGDQQGAMAIAQQIADRTGQNVAADWNGGGFEVAPQGVMAIGHDVELPPPNADAFVGGQDRELAQNGAAIIAQAVRDIGNTQIDRLEEIARILVDIRNREGLVMG